MNEETRQPTSETAEVVRKLVVPDTEPKSEEGKRNPTKTERDLKPEILTSAGEESVEEHETVRKPIVPDA